MKKVGIIGGAGPLASALFYETLIQESYQQACDVPEIFLINFPFTRSLSVEAGRGNRDILRDELLYCVKALVRNKVEVGIVTCNTLHLYLRLLPKVSVPFLFLPHLVMKEAKKNGHHRLLVLGTQNTCQSHLYKDPELEMVYPYTKLQTLIDGVIERVLEGKVLQEDSHTMRQIIAKMAETVFFDGVILGCTDLPVLNHHFPILSDKPFYDTLKIPAKILRSLI